MHATGANLNFIRIHSYT